MGARPKLILLITAILLALAFPLRMPERVRAHSGGYLIDEVGAVDEKTRDHITERNNNLRASCSGAEIFVAVVSSCGPKGVDGYAAELFESRRVGDPDEKNGVLLLLAVDDLDYTIVVGDGLKGTLTTAVLTGIFRNELEPFFAAGDYAGAVRESFRRLNERVAGHYGADPNGYAGDSPAEAREDERGGCASCSGFGAISLAACGACVGYELFSYSGGGE